MPDLIGQALGRYHILERLGEGGMATVYKAFDTRLERFVAVKIIRRSAFPPEQLEPILKRFEREAKALAKLSHPNIVSVIDYGEHEGAPYLVMVFLPSGTLAHSLGRPIPWQEAARLILPIARALEFAHGQGIVHRDVKPANILITLSGEPMLSDFGIAKILESEGTTQLTGTGFSVGTPSYMAPEQWSGKVGPQTDLYSLGVVLYEMITGRKPYTADTPSAILLKQATEPLPRPKAYVPDLPEAVEKVLLKALARKPEDRYPDMAAFIDGLERTLVGQPKGKKFLAFKPATAPKVQPPAKTRATFVDGEQPSSLAPRHGLHPATPSFPAPGKRVSVGRWIAIGAGLVALVSVAAIGLGGIFKPYPPTPTATFTPTRSPTKTHTPTPTPFPGLPIYPANAFPESLIPITADNVSEIINLSRIGGGVPVQADWSPDGSTLAVASTTGIYLYDASSKKEIRLILAPDAVRSVKFSPDGALLAGGLGDYSVRLWRVSDGSLLRTMEGHTSGIISVAFSPDGTILASGGHETVIRLWRVSDGLPLMTLKGHSSSIMSVAFSPDGETLASGSLDKTVRLWKTADGTLLRTLVGHSDYVITTVFSPDGSLLASGSYDKTIRLWKVAEGSLSRKLEGHTDRVYGMAFSPDGSQLASGSSDLSLRIWRVNDGGLEKTLEGQPGTPVSVEFSPDGETLACVNGRVVFLWQTSDWTEVCELDNHADAVLSTDFSPDETRLAYGATPRMSAAIVQIRDGAILQSLEGHTTSIYSVAFSPDGDILASGSPDGTARLWRASDGAPLSVLQGHTGGVISVAFSPDGKMLATGACDNTVKLWQVSDGVLCRTLEGHSDRIQSVSFSPDGTMLASGSRDQTIRLWRIPSGALIRSLKGHAGWVDSVAFSPDGTLLASGSQDKTVRIWQVSNGALLRTLQGHTLDVSTIAFSPDGTLIASGSYDATIRLWRASDGELVRTLKGHTYSLYTVAFSEKGSMLASGSADGTIRIWGIPG
ncbi:MAG: protein kinase [Anaerolineales bacterium]|nr:protein kinase [Anaerolineales bacterium]